MSCRLTVCLTHAHVSPQSTTERLIVRSAVGTIVGAWIGGLALALDWDRPWQVRCGVTACADDRRIHSRPRLVLRPDLYAAL